MQVTETSFRLIGVEIEQPIKFPALRQHLRYDCSARASLRNKTFQGKCEVTAVFI